MRKFEDSLPLKLLVAREASMSFFRPLLQENDLTEQQWRILRALYEHNELDYKQLAKMCCILSPSLTGIINRLEKQGYIHRQKDEADQRRTLLMHTEKSKQLFKRLGPQVDALYKDFFDKFGAEKVEILTTLLDELIELKQ